MKLRKRPTLHLQDTSLNEAEEKTNSTPSRYKYILMKLRKRPTLHLQDTSLNEAEEKTNSTPSRYKS